MCIPKKHVKELLEILPTFEGMVTSMTDVPNMVEIDEPYAKLELLIPDYSVLYFMGYAVGSSTMSAELRPIMDNSAAKLMHLTSKFVEIELYRTFLENYKKEQL